MFDKYGYSDAILGCVDRGHLQLKEAKSSKDIKESHLIIVSKNIRDSHYESYIYCFEANKDRNDMHIVSYFMKELYLGRYLIKRNFYFEKKADALGLFDNLESETEDVRDRYYDGELENSDVPVKIQNYLSDLSGDIEDSENSIGTSYKRQIRDDSTVRDWFARGKETMSKSEIEDFKKESKITEESYLQMLKKSCNNQEMIKEAENKTVDNGEYSEEENSIELWFREHCEKMNEWRENSFICNEENQFINFSELSEEID